MHFYFSMTNNITDNHHIDLSQEILYQFTNGGIVVVYNSINRISTDFQRIVSCAIFFAEQGKQVILTPKFNSPLKNEQYHEIYHSLIGTKYYGKCPDLCIDGIFYEHEGYIVNNPKANFSNMLHRGLAQSDHIIIEKCNLSERIMKKSIRDRIKAGVSIKEIWVHEGKQLSLLFKNTEGQ